MFWGVFTQGLRTFSTHLQIPVGLGLFSRGFCGPCAGLVDQKTNTFFFPQLLYIICYALWRAAVAQEVRAVVCQPEKVAGSIPGLRLAKCRSVPEQDTT